MSLDDNRVILAGYGSPAFADRLERLALDAATYVMPDFTIMA